MTDQTEDQTQDTGNGNPPPKNPRPQQNDNDEDDTGNGNPPPKG